MHILLRDGSRNADDSAINEQKTDSRRALCEHLHLLLVKTTKAGKETG